MCCRSNLSFWPFVLCLAISTAEAAATAEEPDDLLDSSATAWFDCMVVAVHDGDTFRCDDGRRIRIHGIDAPELDHALGPLSRDWLSERISGEVLHCFRRGASYDRMVATCYDDDVDIAAASVAVGMSRDCPGFSGGFYAPLETAANEAIPVAGFCR